MKVGRLLDPHMQMCMQEGLFRPLSFPKIMALWTYFDPIQHTPCHPNSSDMVCWMHMQVGRLLDPHNQMCMNVGCSGPFSSARGLAFLFRNLFTLSSQLL